MWIHSETRTSHDKNRQSKCRDLNSAWKSTLSMWERKNFKKTDQKSGRKKDFMYNFQGKQYATMKVRSGSG